MSRCYRGPDTRPAVRRHMRKRRPVKLNFASRRLIVVESGFSRQSTRKSLASNPVRRLVDDVIGGCTSMKIAI